MNNHEIMFKFILIGDSSVGKSCLLLRFLQGRFKNQHEATLGVEFGSRIVEVGSKKIKLQIWDTAGQESFKSITRSYYRQAIGTLLFFDLSQKVTFQSLKRWLFQIRTYSHQKLRIVLIGSKADLVDCRQVSKEEVDNFLEENNIQNYFEVSSLNGINVDEPFLNLAKQINDAIEEGEITQKQSANGVTFKNKSSPYKPISPVGPEKLTEKSSCC